MSKHSRPYSGKQNWVKMEKEKTEFKNVRFQKAHRNNIFDLRRQGGYIKILSLRCSILNWILKIIWLQCNFFRLEAAINRREKVKPGEKNTFQSSTKTELLHKNTSS